MLLRSAHFIRRPVTGFSLIEVMMVVALTAILGMMATNAYGRYIASARTSSAISDIGKIKLTIDAYRLNHDDRVPNSLSEIGLDKLLDPWGRPYSYLAFAGVKGNASKRKDHNLVPINTDFDLYSMGPDGQSSSPLTAKA